MEKKNWRELVSEYELINSHLGCYGKSQIMNSVVSHHKCKSHVFSASCIWYAWGWVMSSNWA